MTPARFEVAFDVVYAGLGTPRACTFVVGYDVVDRWPIIRYAVDEHGHEAPERARRAMLDAIITDAPGRRVVVPEHVRPQRLTFDITARLPGAARLRPEGGDS